VYADIVELLINNNCDPDIQNYSLKTPLYIVSERGYLEIVNLLKEHSKISVTEGNGYTPLHIACKNNNLQTVEALLDSDFKLVVDSGDIENFTCLHLACENENIEIIELLLKYDCDVNAANSFGWTPLHFASDRGNLDIIDILIAYCADVNIENSKEKKPIHYATSKEIADALTSIR